MTFLSKGVGDEDLDEAPPCMSLNGMKFLVPPRSGKFELGFACILSAVYSGVGAALLHSFTESKLIPSDSSDPPSLKIGVWITMILVSGSIPNRSCFELSIYRDSEDFALFSHHYQRAAWQVVLSIYALTLDKQDDVTWVYLAIIVAYVLQVMGVLPHPWVLCLYVMD